MYTYVYIYVRFKAIVRDVTRHGLGEPKHMFQMETRYYHRRLVPLGIHGNQAAIAVYCKASGEKQAMITEALIQQKIGAISNLLKKIREFKDQRRQQPHGETMLLKIAKLSKGAIIKWKKES